MRPRTILASVILMLVCGLMLPAWASAEVVGNITQVEGRVDLLKGGKLPATPVKLQDKVESGDVLRTKSLSKAQITFIDNSVITLSPESRLAVDEYKFEPAQQKRNAVLNLFQGMAHVLVNKLFKVEEPDFVIKTHTAVLGVRGTDFGIRLQPNSSTILNFQGVTQVANIFPEVGQLDRRAFKAAFAFPSANSPHSVMLQAMQGTTVGRGLPPTLPFGITAEDQKEFLNRLSFGVLGRQKEQGSGSSSVAGGGSSSSGAGTAVTGGGTEFVANPGGPDSGLGTPASPAVPAVAPTGLITGTGNAAVTTLTTVTVPPVVEPVTPVVEPVTPVVPPVIPPVIPPVEPPVIPPPPPPPPPPPTPTTYNFQSTGYSALVSTVSSTTSSTGTSTGWSVRTGSWPAGTFPTYYTTTGTGVRTVLDGALFATGTGTLTTTGTLTGTVTGVLGSNLTGTATSIGSDSFGNTANYTGTVVIEPSGQMTFTYANGTLSSLRRLVTASGTTIHVPGTYFTQTLDGAMLSTSTSPYNTSNTTPLWAGASSTGALSGNYSATLTGTSTIPWDYYYGQQELNNLTGATIQGVLSGPVGGTQTGALTIFDSGADMPFRGSLPLPPTPYLFDRWNFNTPIVGAATLTGSQLTSTIYATDYQDGRFGSGIYQMTQTPSPPVTPVSAVYNFTQSYNGTMGANIGMPGNPSGTIFTYSNGWGLRSATAGSTSGTESLNGYFTAYTNQGTWTLGSGSLPAPPFGYTSTVAVTQMSGSVSGTLGQTLRGNMTFIGSLLNGTSFSYAGPVSIDSSGGLQFNFGTGTYGNGTSYSSTWANFPSGGAVASGTASGTLGQWPGYYFTQTMGTGTSPGTYTLNTTDNAGTLSLFGTGGSRSLVYAGSLGNFSSLFYLNPQGGASLPAPGSPAPLASPLVIEGVVGDLNLGAQSGNATLTVSTGTSGPFNLSVPGQISLTPGGSYFIAHGGAVQNYTTSPYVVNVSSFPPGLPGSPQGQVPTQPLTTGSVYSFSQNYNGFRVGTAITSNLSMVEGYGWGLRTSTGATLLPSNYTGYFVSQDLGTRASATLLNSNWAGVTGTMIGTLSGVSGQPLSGQMTFSGSNTLGVTFNYSGKVSLGTDGRLVYNYYGNWTNSTGQISTGSGSIVQVPGTYFTESVTGSYQQTGTTGTPNTLTLVNSTPLTGTRTDAGATTATTASLGVGVSSPVTTYTNGSGSATLIVTGVVAGPTWGTRWGVASSTPSYTPSGGTASPIPTVDGVVTIDTVGKLTGQFVSQVGNDTIARNLVSVPTASGMTTSSFTQTATGTINQTPVSGTSGTQATITTPIPLSGVSSGTISGQTNTNLAITSTALQPNTYNNAISPAITANMVGAVGGPAGGVQTGVTAIQAVTTIAGTASTSSFLGTATFQPATPTTLPTLIANMIGINPAGSTPALQTGTVTVTKAP